MTELTTSLDSAGRVVLPVAFRRALGLEPGAKVIIQLEADGLKVRSARQALADSQAIVRGYVSTGESLADELIAERRGTAWDE